MNSDSSGTTSLSSIESRLWIVLKQACSDRNHGWRLPVLATQADATPGIRQRVVVLRDVMPEKRCLLFHTDLRSPKVEQIRKNADACLLFYDHQLAVQLKVAGRIAVETDSPEADQLWMLSPSESLRAYLAPQPPGTSADGPEDNLPESVRRRIPERSEVEPGRRNFAALIFRVSDIDWLRLDRDGNRRARFHYEDESDQASGSDRSVSAVSSTAEFERCFRAEWIFP